MYDFDLFWATLLHFSIVPGIYWPKLAWQLVQGPISHQNMLALHHYIIITVITIVMRQIEYLCNMMAYMYG